VRDLLDSLAVRIGLAFLAGLLVLLLAIVVAVLWPDGRPAVLRLVEPRDAAQIAKALETVSPAEQPLVVAALNAGPLIVQLEPGFPDEGALAPGGGRPNSYVGRLYQRYAAELEGRSFRVQTRREAAAAKLRRGELGGPSAVRLLVQLKTGQVLVVERAPVVLQRLAARFAFIAGAAGLVLVLVMLVCIREMAQPAKRLAGAAHRLAAEIDMEDLPVKGATEVRTLSAAFNRMKRTIRELMDERTRVLAAIAHDLRTYLTRLRLRAEFIEDADQRARAIGDLDEMSLLLDDTLMFARETTSTMSRVEKIELRQAIAAFATLRREMGEPVEAVSDAGEGPLWASCAPLTLSRMLANLTDNAIRYGKAARLGAHRDGGWIAISVDDDGPGAPAEAFDRLVQPFERLEPSRGRQTGGAGLGLAIVKALAKSQGGDLTLENRSQGGLRATVRLPAAG
jgi:signal transduction histidine kinase